MLKKVQMLQYFPSSMWKQNIELNTCCSSRNVNLFFLARLNFMKSSRNYRNIRIILGDRYDGLLKHTIVGNFEVRNG